MHDIEPHFQWRDQYIASEDDLSPFYGQKYSEFEYSHRLYNFYIHPQWDSIGSATLYLKVLFVDYEEGVALIELLGEWNDTLHNDIMFFKRNVIDQMLKKNIYKYVIFADNLLNFHSSMDDDYYAEWAEEVNDEQGWIAVLNTRQHVEEEMEEGRLEHYMYFGAAYNNINWRVQKPQFVGPLVEAIVLGRVKGING